MALKLFGRLGSVKRGTFFIPCLFCTQSPPCNTNRLRSWHLNIVSLTCDFRQKSSTYLCRPNLQLFRSTAPNMSVEVLLDSPRSNPSEGLTCLAANLSTCTPQPCRKQLANSKIASTSSPFAAPPFFIPAWSARSSTDAAFDAAAERYFTASAGLGSHPQPCLKRRMVRMGLIIRSERRVATDLPSGT